MKYPKKFEEWYSKNYADRTVFGPNDDDRLKECLFKAWKASAVLVSRRMGTVRRWTEGHYQHEDFDYLQEFVQELFKNERASS